MQFGVSTRVPPVDSDSAAYESSATLDKVVGPDYREILECYSATLVRKSTGNFLQCYLVFGCPVIKVNENYNII